MSDYYAPNQQAVGVTPGVAREEDGLASPETTPYDPSAHTSEEVKAYVLEHPETTGAILLAEREGKNRSGLLSWLESG